MTTPEKIKAALTSEEHKEFVQSIKNMATDAIKWRNLLQERLNIDVAEEFEAWTGAKFPYPVRDLILWTEDAEKSLGPLEGEEGDEEA